ncbi:MAG: 2-C-methyl-D-erythritol 4-phosphate cytidylyltransferase [Bacteroidales bacterium]|nr:2-C-methyl-D-erythritol 4-phosphate cytidylyltransferase [Bacteroidales bacterium]
MNKIVLIVAGGSGTRMNSETPKQFMLLQNRPVLMHTLSVFYHYNRDMEFILALPESQAEKWNELCKTHDFGLRHQVVSGGETRFHTVKKNIAGLPNNSLVAIHDGVRPLVSLDTIDRCFRVAAEFGNAVPCIEIPETLRRLSGKRSRQVNRTKYRLIQTPQIFLADILKEAYNQDYRSDFTDDAGVVENLGHAIHLVQGNGENIKITYPQDLVVAGALLKNY